MVVTPPKYSICITNYNKGDRVNTSIGSLLTEIDNRFEVIVTDGMSNDGSEEILRKFDKSGAIRLFEMKCSRGRGRQIAFEKAVGSYVVSGIDTDDLLLPTRLPLLLDFYHRKCEGNLLRVMESGIVVAPTELIRRLGGWRDLQFSENWDIAERAARVQRYVWTIFRVKAVIQEANTISYMKKNKLRYRKYLDWLRLRRRPFSDGEKIGVQKRADYLLARISLLRLGHLNSIPPDFADDDRRRYVDSSDWWHKEGEDETEETKWYRRHMKEFPNWGSPPGTARDTRQDSC